MDKLKYLIENCKNSVTVEVNGHRDIYMSVLEFLEDDSNEIDKGILNKMVETDMVVRIQFYPDTPVGFYIVYHYDVEKALDECIEILNIRK